VPQVVDRDDPDLVVVADAAEGADQIARLDRPWSAQHPQFRPRWPGIVPGSQVLGQRGQQYVPALITRRRRLAP
jgi:hypothetical protein